MLQAALLAAVLTATSSEPAIPAKAPIQACFAAMDGAVFHGDPTNKPLLESDLLACTHGAEQLATMRATSEQGPEKLFLLGRLLDRAATLAYMGLGDARAAFTDVKRANLYFRIASGLRGESDDYLAAAVANVRLTEIQLNTLTTDLTSAARAPHVALTARKFKHPRADAADRLTADADVGGPKP